MVTGETGTVAAGYDYLPFGEVVRESGGMAGVGLDNFLARFKSPDALFADPLENLMKSED